MSILSLVSSKGIFISAFHIAGVRNVIADGLSRTKPLSSEWSLDDASFQWIVSKFFLPQIDLFATAENKKLEAYVSPVPDSQAVAVDAFRVDWNWWDEVYLFPPTSLLLRVLQVLETFRGRALLITPDWPHQAWFPLLTRRARTSVLLPAPHLSQRVGVRSISCGLRAFHNLRCWSF